MVIAFKLGGVSKKIQMKKQPMRIIANLIYRKRDFQYNSICDV
nr:hypothetical protein BAR15_120337 [Bartonella sp. AR 15-3]